MDRCRWRHRSSRAVTEPETHSATLEYAACFAPDHSNAYFAVHVSVSTATRGVVGTLIVRDLSPRNNGTAQTPLYHGHRGALIRTAVVAQNDARRMDSPHA